jgi:hypothetical protein
MSIKQLPLRAPVTSEDGLISSPWRAILQSIAQPPAVVIVTPVTDVVVPAAGVATPDATISHTHYIDVSTAPTIAQMSSPKEGETHALLLDNRTGGAAYAMYSKFHTAYLGAASLADLPTGGRASLLFVFHGGFYWLAGVFYL